MKVRLLLGDQLYPLHPWFDQVDEQVVYVLMEVRQETDYAPHHIQKVVAFFGAMRAFAQTLKSKGHRVEYIAIDDENNRQSIPENLDIVCQKYNATAFGYQSPDEYRLDQQLADYCAGLSILTSVDDSHHFLTSREELAAVFCRQKTTGDGIFLSPNAA